MNILHTLTTRLKIFSKRSKNHTNIQSIRYFSQDGSSLPNSVAFHKGNFIHQCNLNKKKFLKNNTPLYFLKNDKVSIFSCKTHHFSQDKGGMILFPSQDKTAADINTEFIITQVQKTAAHILYNKKQNTLSNRESNINPTIFSIGNFFKGSYLAQDQKTFNKDSIAIEFLGLDKKRLFQLATAFCRETKIQTVLVYDYHLDQLYLVKKKL